MLNHTYTSVKNANLVDCGKKQHISSQPFPLLKDNFLGEFRTELEKKKVLANLGIASELSLEWEYIKGDIGRSEALTKELDSRTKYISKLDGFTKNITEGIQYLETIIGGEQEGEEEQNERLTTLETTSKELSDQLTELKAYLEQTIEIDIDTLEKSLKDITDKVNNITDLIQVSSKAGNALSLLTSEYIEEGEIPGLYVPDLSKDVNAATENIGKLQEDVKNINESLVDFVTREELGGDDFDFVNQDDFDNYKEFTDNKLDSLETELNKTVKTGEDGHVDTLYVNTISKDNNEGNIVITDSFEVDSDIPLDIRFVRETLEDLYALPVKVCYPGMGVVVNALSSLYILRRPAEGVVFNQEYIANPNNWKCPEDLVTVAMTRQEYENLKEEEINPNVFYYIFEEEITRTQEPKREEYETDEQFQKEWQKWVDSLKTLSQEYMSAAWGVDIENKIALKASEQSILSLSKEIEELKGGGTGISLESLNTEINALKNEDLAINERLDEIINTVDGVESGRLINVETQIATVNENLKTYITKDELAELSDDFNFVKPEDYEADKESFNETLAKNLTTQQITLNGNVVSVQEGVLQVNSQSIAKVSEVPNIEVLPQDEYDKLENIDENTYYYTYDEDTIYVTQAELTRKLKSMQDQIDVLSQSISTLEKTIEDLKALHPQDKENV